jgi:hypothetical protein
MKIGDLVYRKKEVYSDKILYLSDYSHDEEGNLVSIRDLVGVVVTKDRHKPNAWRRFRPTGGSVTAGITRDGGFQKLSTLVDDSKVWVAWTPEIKSLEWTDDLKTFDEDDLDPFEGLEGE